LELCKKKEKNVDEQVKYFRDYETGNAYAYLDIKRETGFFVGFSVGKWIQETCDELYEIISKRTQQPTYKRKISFCTDGNDQNLSAILKNFHKDSVNYGRVKKIRQKQTVIGLYKEKVFGNMSYEKIRINNVDAFCSKLRARVGCFVRKTRNFAKKRKQIYNVLNIIQVNHNFIEANNKVTPAMKENLIDKKLDWDAILNMRLSFKI